MNADNYGKSGWGTAILLVILLGLVFHESFVSGMVLTSNDAPLGRLMADALALPYTFTGLWDDLNWIGLEQPSALPSVSVFLNLVLQPVLFSKFHALIGLLIVGLCAWMLFRQLELSPVACSLGALAAALNMNSFSNACWGLSSRALTMAAVFLALAALVSRAPRPFWIKAALAGLATGMGVMEGFDVGAIYSLYVAAFALFLFVIEGSGPVTTRALKGIGWVALIAFFAAFISAQALSTLIGTQIRGVSGMEQTQEARDQRWAEATQWSLPKIETLRVVVPGLFGYRMDTPEGGNYWGRVGEYPGRPGTRHSGSGEYAGILPVLLAIFCFTQVLRRKNSPFSDRHRRIALFWAVAMLLSLLFAWGRHAPFYAILYELPFFSTIRNPIKFMHPFHLGLLILFAYGVDALCRRYLQDERSRSPSSAAVSASHTKAKTGATPSSFSFALKQWWKENQGFEKKWTIGCLIAFAVACVAALLFASSQSELVRHLQNSGFDVEGARRIASFAFKELGWSLLFLALTIAILTGILTGYFRGPRSKLALSVAGLLLVADLARADFPWIVYSNYKKQYASHDMIDILREESHERRVTAPPLGFLYLNNQQYGQMWNIFYQWLQHEYQFYNIQSLDIIQLPRPTKQFVEFRRKTFPDQQVHRLPRLWALTNTRFILGMKGALNTLNQLNTSREGFRIHTSFTFTQQEDQVVPVADPNGMFALFEFTRALPRARLFSQWEYIEDDQQILARLSDPEFNPHRTLLVSMPQSAETAALPKPPAPGQDEKTAGPPGSTEITHYEPKEVILETSAEMETILLLNSNHDEDWKVWVDGQPAQLLRCNFTMRGVRLPAGDHTVRFHYEPSVTGLYISLGAILLGAGLCLYLGCTQHGRKENQHQT